MSEPDWAAELEGRAPDVVAVWRAIDDGLFAFRRQLRQRVSVGSAPGILRQQEAVAEALAAILASMPESALRAPGGEEDWNVAQAFAHTTGARRFLARAGALAAQGTWPDPPPAVTPGVPGPSDASLDRLLLLLDKSQRSMAESAAAITGHETDPCPLEHSLVGRLRCGEWLLWAGAHDLMHLEQLHRIADETAADG